MPKKSMEELLALKKAADKEFKKKSREKERRKLSISLNICPECGAPIKSEPYEVFDTPKIYLFGLIKIKGEEWDYRMVCSENKHHYEDKGYEDYDCMY